MSYVVFGTCTEDGTKTLSSLFSLSIEAVATAGFLSVTDQVHDWVGCHGCNEDSKDSGILHYEGRYYSLNWTKENRFLNLLISICSFETKPLFIFLKDCFVLCAMTSEFYKSIHNFQETNIYGTKYGGSTSTVPCTFDFWCWKISRRLKVRAEPRTCWVTKVPFASLICPL
jgi:hypothetical protein